MWPERDVRQRRVCTRLNHTDHWHAVHVLADRRQPTS